MRLRYGENPHQNAVLYGDFDKHFEKLHGKELSFNNILDISAATNLIAEFEQPTVAILKHTNPCGVGSDTDLRNAWDKAFATDKQAPFGGIIICNRPLDEPLAKAISEIFSEVIIAPDFDAEARSILQKKKNLRLIRLTTSPIEARSATDIRSVSGGLLAQDADVAGENHPEGGHEEATNQNRGECHVVRVASRQTCEIKCDRLCPGRSHPWHWRRSDVACGFVAYRRLESEEPGCSLKGSAVASDAFFPFAGRLDRRPRCGRHLRHSTGRIGSRRRSDRCRRTSAEHGDALHWRPAFRH
jgi:phosphoribosylaminoimidazolecarboxamide formyltransferase/IMP cyclohydrolase